jgi:hypothetical protein
VSQDFLRTQAIQDLTLLDPFGWFVYGKPKVRNGLYSS